MNLKNDKGTALSQQTVDGCATFRKLYCIRTKSCDFFMLSVSGSLHADKNWFGVCHDLLVACCRIRTKPLFRFFLIFRHVFIRRSYADLIQADSLCALWLFSILKINFFFSIVLNVFIFFCVYEKNEGSKFLFFHIEKICCWCNNVIFLTKLISVSTETLIRRLLDSQYPVYCEISFREMDIVFYVLSIFLLNKLIYKYTYNILTTWQLYQNTSIKVFYNVKF